MRDVCPTRGRSSAKPSLDRGRYHLTAPEVARIRAQIRVGKTDTEIAAMFGVARMTVSGIRRRKSWSA